MMHVMLWVGFFVMILSGLSVFFYVASFFTSAFGVYPWWSIIFLFMGTCAGFYMQKIAKWELRRQASLQGDLEE
jgi:F0F1-type ATP synthase assembly protein I